MRPTPVFTHSLLANFWRVIIGPIGKLDGFELAFDGLALAKVVGQSSPAG